MTLDTEVPVYQGDLGTSPRHSEHVGDFYQTIKKTLFIVGSASIIFIALSNTLTYQLQRFWGASGNFWQYQWDNILETYGDHPLYLFVIGNFVVGYAVYWGMGLIYTFMDVTRFPKALRKYKIQTGSNDHMDMKKLMKLIFVVHINQIISIPVGVAFFYLYKFRGYNDSKQLSTFHWVIFELAIFILLEEIGFYYSHRLFHHRALYKHFHKQHHEWQAPIAITAIYCHPLEHVCANLAPIFLGPLIMGSHITTMWLWISLAILSTLNAHSGYHLPFLPSPEAHDYHHLKFNQCYGVLGILDLLHGTDDQFRTTKCFSRHIMMLSFQPPHEAFPDDTKEAIKGKSN